MTQKQLMKLGFYLSGRLVHHQHSVDFNLKLADLRYLTESALISEFGTQRFDNGVENGKQIKAAELRKCIGIIDPENT